MSKAFVRAAQYSDADAICLLLHTRMNSKISVERWLQLMNYKWLDNKPDFGYVVESDGQVLGYCGMVYADRTLGMGDQLRTERIVSMSSWYLDKSLRGKGLGRDMLIECIKDPTLTYATLTNSKKPLAIVEALGFQVLEDHRYCWRKTGQLHPSVIIITDVHSILDRIDSHQKKIINDMHGYALVPMLVEVDRQQSLLFFSIKSKADDVLWYDLMHASDQEIFVHCAQALADCLLPDSPSVLAADGRFVNKAPAGTASERLPVARYYVSQRVAPREIDHLYSELQLLDLKLD